MAKKKPTAKSSDGPRFEETLSKLEGIVRQLEEGEIGLDEALGAYETGVNLLRRAYETLQQAERKVELLSGVDAQGNPVTRPFDEQDSGSLEEKAGRRDRRRSMKKTPEEGSPRSEGSGLDSPGELF